MKIFNSEQIKEWDTSTIKEQGIRSIDLMERAANACFGWLLRYNFTRKNIYIFCGKGNNGGDGLALARILLENNITVSVYILESGKPGSSDFQENLQRLHRITTEIHFIQQGFSLPDLKNDDLIIDALYGTGLNKPLNGISGELAISLNKTSCQIISIDVPSGLFTDKSTKGCVAISATHTLSFQNYKLAYLFPENSIFTGQLHLLDIGLSKLYENEVSSVHELLDNSIIMEITRPRSKFSHKGNFGHAALVAGSYGMMGAAVLAARSCLHAGTGKLTCVIPSCGYDILQSVVPEAMCRVSGEKNIESLDGPGVYDAIGIGPGIGLQKGTGAMLKKIFKDQPAGLLLDADALNCISADKKLFSLIPKGSVITPHPKEFERLFGKTSNDFERLELAVGKASELKIYIVLKGHYTAIITPYGKVYFNSTGNAGMAKAGMGDVLSGIITGFLAQHYLLPEAAILGVYIHGLAGDIAAGKFSQPAMQASDLINCMPDAWKVLQQ